jgi:hypothetical protein
MGFLKPKIPDPKAPPNAPVVDDAIMMRNEQDRAASRRRGAATTLLTSPTGLPSLGSTASARPMGS